MNTIITFLLAFLHHNKKAKKKKRTGHHNSRTSGVKSLTLHMLNTG